jgi:hypothetical protein
VNLVFIEADNNENEGTNESVKSVVRRISAKNLLDKGENDK